MPLVLKEGFKNKDCTKLLLFCPALVSRFIMLNFLYVLLYTKTLKFFHSILFKLKYDDACFEERIKNQDCTKTLEFFKVFQLILLCFFFSGRHRMDAVHRTLDNPFYHPKKIAMTLSSRTLEKRSSKIRSCGTYRRKSARQPRRGTRIDASPCLRH